MPDMKLAYQFIFKQLKNFFKILLKNLGFLVTSIAINICSTSKPINGQQPTQTSFSRTKLLTLFSWEKISFCFASTGNFSSELKMIKWSRVGKKLFVEGKSFSPSHREKFPLGSLKALVSFNYSVPWNSD